MLGSTVKEDGSEDMLTGAAGDDWFFFDTEDKDKKDRATDLAPCRLVRQERKIG